MRDHFGNTDKGRGEEKAGRRACLVSKYLPGDLVKGKKNCRPEALAQGYSACPVSQALGSILSKTSKQTNIK